MTESCGHARPVSGASALVCNLDAGHGPVHGLRLSPELAPFVTWPDAPHVVTAQTWAPERLAWTKPHKRRVYKSAKQARQELEFANERNSRESAR